MNKTKIASYTTGTTVDTSSNSLAPLTQHRRGTKAGECPLCMRATELTFHHLIPKKMHRRRFFQKNYKREQLALVSIFVGSATAVFTYFLMK